MGAMTMNMAPISGPIYDTGQGQAPVILDSSPNTGMTMARFATSMEAAMVEIKVVNDRPKESERSKEKEKRVKPVADSTKDSRIDERDPERRPEEIKLKMHAHKPEEIAEDLFDPIPGGTLDFKA